VSAASLVFRAGSLLCALPLDDIAETMRPLPVRPLAGMPQHVAGVSVVRGTPVPVVDVAALLGDDSNTAPSRFIVVRGEHGQAALATGDVVGIEEVAPARAGIAVRGREPVFTLRGASVVPADAWATLEAAAGQP
jgi:purine-binding chemotaxis protein CheW